MKLVRDGLFIGNITDANSMLGSSPGCDAAADVTHMLSLLSSQLLQQHNLRPGDPYAPLAAPPTPPTPPTPAAAAAESSGAAPPQELVRMTVPLRDMESENLLDHLDACLAFIERGRKSGRVLVHCLAGVSRSAAVITAHLMQSEKLSLDDALASLRQASPSACPNEGFMEQLKMFEEMGFEVDRESPIFKRFHVANLGQTYRKGEKIECSRFACSPSAENTSVMEGLASQLKLQDDDQKGAVLYRCKKCRRLVASESNVIAHSASGDEPAVFKSKRKGGRRDQFDDNHGEKCSSLFVEPMQWMTAVIEGHVEGKLCCAGCQARLGNFHWAGLQCSCGAWVNPAFQLHKSRMDLARN